MNDWEQVRDDLQLIAESMCAVTGVDITIVDDTLLRVVGTGPMRAEIGGRAPKGSAFQRCLDTGRQYSILQPKQDPLCIGCAGRGSCRERVELCIPIKESGKTIGVLGMCAFDEDARQNFVENHENYIRFENQLSGLVVSVLNARRFGALAEYRSQELLTVINSLNEGIAILSEQGEVLTVNRFLQKRLGLDAQRPPDVRALLTPPVCESFAKRGFAGEAGPVALMEDQYLISARPIMVQKRRAGTVLVFSDLRRMKESVLRASRSRDMVTFDDLIGESEAMRGVRRQAMQIAGQDVAVLLCGETGTGKEIFARAIHSASRRSNDVLMPVNCGAIPDTLIESELFGHEKGAFTGAAQVKPGLFEICKNGTLFLDEVGDLPLSAQVKLLRALEEKTIMRVGSTVELQVNPRIISAAHGDLSERVRAGAFRGDLFYRLNVVSIHIPPLRERGYDVIVLARHFLEKYGAVYSRRFAGFTAECERFLMSYDFPGNIRELRNLIEYAVIFEEGEKISEQTVAAKLGHTLRGRQTLSEQTRAFERGVVRRALDATDGSLPAKREVAAALGISLTTLYRKLEESDTPSGG